MAEINFDFKSFKFQASKMSDWKAFKRAFKSENSVRFNKALDDRTLYIMRLCPPFTIAYKNENSPTIYIGRGNFQSRVTAHLRNWIYPLAKHIQDLRIEIRTCQPRARNNVEAYQNAEADIIWEFQEKFGEKPLKNKAMGDGHPHVHSYPNQGEIWSPGQGNKFFWALRPTEIHEI